MSEQNIDSLCKAIENAASSILDSIFGPVWSVAKKVKSTDDVLNFKFNILKAIIETRSIEGLKSYKYFFTNSDASNDLNNQKGTNWSKIERVDLGNSTNNWNAMRSVFFNIVNFLEFNDKVRLSDVENAINNKQKLAPNNGFIKICKGIYKFTYGFPENSENSAKTLSYALNEFARNLNVNKWAVNGDKLKYVFEHIQDIQCEDEEFKGFKKRLEYCVYNETMEQFEVNKSKMEEKKEIIVHNNIRVSSSTASQNETDEEFKGFKERLEYCVYDKDKNEFQVDNSQFEQKEKEKMSYYCNNIKFYPQSEEKISKKKLFLLIATVIFLAAVIFFTINLILEFLAISQTLAIILAAIATIALVASLVISIKNDVINKPACLGGEKSFIDLYQNKGERKKEVEPYKDSEKEYGKESNEDSEI